MANEEEPVVDEEEEELEEDSEEEVSEESSEDNDVAEEEAVTEEEIPVGDRIEILLFDRWSFDDVEVDDLSLQQYINLRPIIVPHSGGKHQHKKFWKTEHISIIERFINKLMTPGLVKKRIKGRGSSYDMGKKQKLISGLRNAFAIIEAKTGDNPIQVLVDAIQNAAPREETTRISLGGISYQQAVDIAPQRRVDLGLKIIVQSIVGLAYNNIITFEELLAKELILAASNDPNSKAVKRKDEIERVAVSAR